MPKQAATLSQLVIRFYLSAPLAEVDALQPTLREIYHQRAAQRAKIVAGKAAATAPTTKGKGKGKGKGKAAAAASGFGGKEVVASPSPTQEVTV